MLKGQPKFNTESSTLLITLGEKPSDFITGDLSMEIKNKDFEEKKELHITIIGFRNGKKVKELIEDLPNKTDVIRQIIELADKTDWTFGLKPEIYHIAKDYILKDYVTGAEKQEKRESVIQMLESKNIHEFFGQLNEILGTDFRPPPLHITLYTRGTEQNGQAGIGINSWDEFQKINPKLLKRPGLTNYTKIILPTRPQPDTIVAIFILKKFGENLFPGIGQAEIDFWQIMPAGEKEESLDKKGFVLIDLGGGRFDHHDLKSKTTASDLISSYLEVADNPALAKLMEYARRDDFFGKGTISTDPLDRAFGLSALIAALNKSLVKEPSRVVETVLPLLEAHYNEEVKRTLELPKEFEEKLASGEAETFLVKQRDKKLKVVIVNSDSGSLAGYLRSRNGGGFDVVAQWLPSNHVNILTRPAKRIDLRSLIALLRMEEATSSNYELSLSVRELAKFGRLKEVPEWYYDPATNSIQNGGLNPKEINPTKIPRDKFKKIMELGLSEQLWDPR